MSETQIQIQKLLENAKPLNQKELVLETYNRHGWMLNDVADFEIVHGEAEVKKQCDVYTNMSVCKNLIIPKTELVIIRWHFAQYSRHGYHFYEEKIYIYTEDGWKVAKESSTV